MAGCWHPLVWASALSAFIVLSRLQYHLVMGWGNSPELYTGAHCSHHNKNNPYRLVTINPVSWPFKNVKCSHVFIMPFIMSILLFKHFSDTILVLWLILALKKPKIFFFLVSKSYSSFWINLVKFEIHVTKSLKPLIKLFLPFFFFKKIEV